MRTKGFIVGLAVLMLTLIAGIAWAGDIALTTIGQSPDAMMVKVVLKKMKISPDMDNLLNAEGLKESRILIAVVGGSSKGLGAAGIDKDQENQRASELLSAARDQGVKVLIMHVGGEGRRGKLSDAFISTAVPFADELIIVEGANEDGLFNTLIEGKDIQIRVSSNVRSTSEPLKEVLSGWGLTVQ